MTLRPVAEGTGAALAPLSSGGLAGGEAQALSHPVLYEEGAGRVQILHDRVQRTKRKKRAACQLSVTEVTTRKSSPALHAYKFMFCRTHHQRGSAKRSGINHRGFKPAFTTNLKTPVEPYFAEGTEPAPVWLDSSSQSEALATPGPTAPSR